jgi:hypothetical protein
LDFYYFYLSEVLLIMNLANTYCSFLQSFFHLIAQMLFIESISHLYLLLHFRLVTQCFASATSTFISSIFWLLFTYSIETLFVLFNPITTELSAIHLTSYAKANSLSLRAKYFNHQLRYSKKLNDLDVFL